MNQNTISQDRAHRLHRFKTMWIESNDLAKAAYVMTIAFTLSLFAIPLLGSFIPPQGITLESAKALYILALVFSLAGKDWKPALIATISGAALWYPALWFFQLLN